MSSSSFASNFDSPASLAGAYAHNVGTAARAFVAALFAVKPRQLSHQAGEVTISPRAKAKNRMELFRMANHYDSTMPNFSAELRSMACRD